jgi:hypothetical protein
VPEQASRLYVVPPANAERPLHELDEILTTHGASAPGLFTLSDGRTAWEVIVGRDTAILELAFVAKGWTPVEQPHRNR